MLSIEIIKNNLLTGNVYVYVTLYVPVYVNFFWLTDTRLKKIGLIIRIMDYITLAVTTFVSNIHDL